MVKRAHEHGDVDGSVLERELLATADHVPGAVPPSCATAAASCCSEISTPTTRAPSSGELAHQPAAAAADVDHVLARRTDEPLEYGQIGVHVAGQGAAELKPRAYRPRASATSSRRPLGRPGVMALVPILLALGAICAITGRHVVWLALPVALITWRVASSHEPRAGAS